MGPGRIDHKKNTLKSRDMKYDDFTSRDRLNAVRLRSTARENSFLNHITPAFLSLLQQFAINFKGLTVKRIQ